MTVKYEGLTVRRVNRKVDGKVRDAMKKKMDEME